MKKLNFLIAVVAVLSLVFAVALNAYSSESDKAVAKDTSKQTVGPVGKSATQQPTQTTPHDPAQCAERHAAGKCQGHSAGSCDPAKCAEKHAKGQCQGHSAGKCRKAPSEK